MRSLHDKVNIVPVIAKADTLTKNEVVHLKQRILREIQENHIQIYQFPEADEEEDDAEFIAVNKELKVSFLCMCATTIYLISSVVYMLI
jgi:Septin family protein